MRVDLHIHSTASDGCWSPEQIVEQVKQTGINLFAVADHDAIGSVLAVVAGTAVWSSRAKTANFGRREYVYAAYAVSEEVLGVDPLYYWVDKGPAPQERIVVRAGCDKRLGPSTFKHPGWLINDKE